MFGLSGLVWVLTSPDTPQPYEREVLAGALLLGALVGMLVGARVPRGVMQAATSLGIIAALTPLSWLRGPLLAVALALPFALAARDRVAPTLFGVLRVLLAWLVANLAALAARYGWDTVHPGMASREPRAIAREVGSASWDLVRTSWRQASESLMAGYTEWFWVAGVLALVLVMLRVVRHLRRRPSRAERAESRKATESRRAAEQAGGEQAGGGPAGGRPAAQD